MEWVELRDINGFRKFGTVLQKLEIPFTNNKFDDIDTCIEKIFSDIFT